MMHFIVFDETEGRSVDEYEAYGETSEYGNSDAPCWYGDAHEARKIADRLAEGTGHRFTVRRD